MIKEEFDMHVIIRNIDLVEIFGYKHYLSLSKENREDDTDVDQHSHTDKTRDILM